MPEEHTDSIRSWARWFNKDLHLSFFYFYIYLIGDLENRKTSKRSCLRNTRTQSKITLIIAFDHLFRIGKKLQN
jgi:hypothetical protein